MSIQEHLNKIRNAIYGKEVRESIAKGIETAYDDASENGNANMEVRIARGTHPNLRSRLDETTAQLAHKVDKGEVSVSDINKNLGKLDETYMTDEFIQQITGNTPVSAIPADGSLTTKKYAYDSITPQEVTFVNSSTNMFNKDGYLIRGKGINVSSGQLEDNASSNVTDFIPIKSNETYTTSQGVRLAFYDEAKNFITSRASNDGKLTPNTPNNAAFIRLGVLTSHLNTAQLNRGAELLPYEAYSTLLNQNLLRTMNFAFIQNVNDRPNVDTALKQITFPKPFSLVYNNGVYQFTGTDFEVVELAPHASFQYIIFNSKNKTMRSVTTTHRSTPELEDDDFILMFLTFEDSVTKLVNCFSSVEVNLNGEPFDSNGNTHNGSSDNNFPYSFVPETPYYNYEAETLDEVIFNHHNTTSDFVYTKYDELIENNSGYISKTLLGHNQSGELPIYKLELNPETRIDNLKRKPLPTVVIVAGLHGDGSGGFGDGTAGDPPIHAYTLYYLVKNIVENWKSSEALEYLRWNVRFVIIPIANPWGFDNKSRHNSRGVDINRNFAHGWKTGGTTGSSAESERETQYIRDVLQENNDAVFAIDLHAIGGLEVIIESYLLRYFLTDNDEASYQIAEQTIRKVSRLWNGKYGLSNRLFYGYGEVADYGGELRAFSHNEIGVPCATVEGFLATSAHPEKSSPTIIKMNSEFLGNHIMNGIRYFYNKEQVIDSSNRGS